MMAKMERAIKLVFLVTVIITFFLTKEYIVQGSLVFLEGMKFLSVAYLFVIAELLIFCIAKYVDIQDFKELKSKYENIKEIRNIKSDILYDERQNNNKYQKAVFNQKIIKKSEEFMEECNSYERDRKYKHKEVQRMLSNIQNILEETKKEENNDLPNVVTE